MALLAKKTQASLPASKRGTATGSVRKRTASGTGLSATVLLRRSQRLVEEAKRADRGRHNLAGVAILIFFY